MSFRSAACWTSSRWSVRLRSVTSSSAVQIWPMVTRPSAIRRSRCSSRGTHQRRSFDHGTWISTMSSLASKATRSSRRSRAAAIRNAWRSSRKRVGCSERDFVILDRLHGTVVGRAEPAAEELGRPVDYLGPGGVLLEEHLGAGVHQVEGAAPDPLGDHAIRVRLGMGRPGLVGADGPRPAAGPALPLGLQLALRLGVDRVPGEVVLQGLVRNLRYILTFPLPEGHPVPHHRAPSGTLLCVPTLLLFP